MERKKVTMNWNPTTAIWRNKCSLLTSKKTVAVWPFKQAKKQATHGERKSKRKTTKKDPQKTIKKEACAAPKATKHAAWSSDASITLS
jgi:hypothetical protein